MKNTEPDLISFNIDSSAAMHVAVAATRRLSFMSDMSIEDRALISTVVSELCTNILKFAVKGRVIISRIKEQGKEAIQVIAEDERPGIADLEKAMKEGYSSANTLGLGLPAVKRIMSTVKIETGTEQGTRIIAEKWLVSKDRDNKSVN